MNRELEDITEVRASARRHYDSEVGYMEQRDLKVFLPPHTAIWNNWRGQQWRLKITELTAPYHDTQPWCEFGRDGGAWAIIARSWRHWLSERELDAEECPIMGLLDSC